MADEPTQRELEVNAAKAAMVSDQISMSRQEFGDLVRSFNALIARGRVLTGLGLLEPGNLRDEHFFGANAGINAEGLLTAFAKVTDLDAFAAEKGISPAIIQVM